MTQEEYNKDVNELLGKLTLDVVGYWDVKGPHNKGGVATTMITIGALTTMLESMLDGIAVYDKEDAATIRQATVNRLLGVTTPMQ